jgi:hypothetical protein
MNHKKKAASQRARVRKVAKLERELQATQRKLQGTVWDLERAERQLGFHGEVKMTLPEKFYEQMMEGLAREIGKGLAEQVRGQIVGELSPYVHMAAQFVSEERFLSGPRLEEAVKGYVREMMEMDAVELRFDAHVDYRRIISYNEAKMLREAGSMVSIKDGNPRHFY